MTDATDCPSCSTLRAEDEIAVRLNWLCAFRLDPEDRDPIDQALALIATLRAERDRARKALRNLQEGAAAALMKLGPDGDGSVADFLCAIHREAVRGLLADDGVTNEAEALLRPHPPANQV